MKELIKTIAKNLDLSLKEIIFNDFNFLFISYPEKDDFFLFLFCTHQELNDKLVRTQSIEYVFNSLVKDFKKEHLFEYKERYIDNNLSLIIVLDVSGVADKDLNQLHVVEENYIIAKKYILTYKSEEFNELYDKINNTDSVINQLNQLAIEYSDLLKNEINFWYLLLMKLFIKVPFLNYNLEETNRESLYNISDVINSKLNDKEKSIFEEIDLNYNNENIEDFIETYNLLDNGESDDI